MRLALFAAVLAAASPAAADLLDTDSDEGIREVSHEVAVRFPAPDLAELTVRRSFANDGETAAGFSLSVDLPEGAVVTDMRTRSGRTWHRAALLPADVARDRYQSLPAGQGVPEQDPVILTFSGLGRVDITAAEVPARGALSVEYTLRMVADRERGRLRVDYSHAGGEGLAAPVIRVDAARRAWIDGVEVLAGASRILAAPRPTGGPTSVSSILLMPEDKSARSGVVRAFISHDRPDDLAVEVVSSEARQRLIAPGTSDALAKLRAGVTLAPRMLGALGDEWKLVVTDTEPGNDGVLHSWRLDIVDTDGAASVHRSRRPARILDAVSGPAEQTTTATIEVELDPGKLAARHGRALFAAGKSSVTRLHLDAPDAFSRTPADLHVVFVLDASRSLSDEEVRAQLAVAAAYLKAAPNARFELVRFDRRARRLLDRFAPASELAAVIDRLDKSGAFATANGSHLERGLEAAAVALRGERKRRRLTGRVVALTDGLVRSRFDNAMGRRALRGAPRGTVMHLIEAGPVSGAEADERLDDHPLAPIAAATGGMAIGVDPEADPELVARSALHLVRPIRVDHFAVSGPFAGESKRDGPLYEGTGRRFTAILDDASPASLDVRGLLWARPVHRSVAATRADGDLAAGLVFGSGDHTAIPDAEHEALALRGHVVSSATSLLTVKPGERLGLGLSGWGWGSMCSGCSFGTIGRGTAIGSAPAAIVLRAPLARCAERLGAGVELAAKVDLETSNVEIVDVVVSAADRRVRDCLTEAIWAHQLRPEQAAGPLAKHVIELSRAQLSAAPAAASRRE